MKRELNGNLTPRERSVSPMFGSLIARGFPAKNGNVAVGKEEEQEESKELPPTDTINMQAPGGAR